MSFTAVQVAINAGIITTGPLPNGRVRFQALKVGIEGGIVVPGTPTWADLDANGLGVATLWGHPTSQYAVTIVSEKGKVQWAGQAAVPAYDCNLHDILDLEAEQHDVNLARQWATKTDGEVATGQGYGAKKYAQDAAVDADQTGQDREATGQDREATGQDREQTGLDRLATSGDRAAVAADRAATELARDDTTAARNAAVSVVATGGSMPYVSAAEALADGALANGASFSVLAGGNTAVSVYKKRLSPNQYNSALRRAGFLVNSLGAVAAAAGWACTNFMAVVPGQQWTISYTTKRVGVSFFSTATDSGNIAGTYTSSAANPLTVTVPAGANYMVVNLQSDTVAESNVQIELGASATTYRAYNTYYAEAVTAYPSSTYVDSLAASVASTGDRLAPLPTDYIQNVLSNGNLATAATWTYTGSATRSDVSAVSELAAVGVDWAYAIPAGGSASQVRLNGSALAALGIQAGDNVLIGSFVYASDGVFPTGITASHTWTVDGVILAPDSTGYVQVSTHVQFIWAKKAIPAGSFTQIIIGFTSSSNGFPASAATRYHTGFYVHHSTTAAPTPTLADIARYTGWAGQESSSVLFDTLEAIAADYGAGVLGQADTAPKLSLAGNGDLESYVEVVRDGKTIRRTFRAFTAVTAGASSAFDFRKDMVDGVAIRSVSDDAAPYRTLGTTLGANHGWAMTKFTVAGHDKVTADIGSVYTKSGVEAVVIGIVDANTLYLAHRTSNSQLTAGTFTWVSGGSNHADITASAPVSSQLYPPYMNYSMKVFVDGVEITAREASMTYARDVMFMESYELLQRADVIAWFEANGSTGSLAVSGAPAISISLTYAFDFEAHCTVCADYLALTSSIALQDIMFLQAQRPTPGADGSTIRYLIPKALPFTHEGNALDFANIQAIDTSAWTTRADLTPARCQPTGILCDRVIQMTDHYGYAIGYAPVQDAAVSTRRTQATVKALQVSNSSAKVYMSAIDKGSLTLSKGAYFSVIGYRNLLVLPTSGRTSCYPVRTNGRDYLYVDWHATGIDRVPIPPDFAGRSFSVVDSGNVNVMSGSLTSSLLVDVTASPAFLVLEVQ